LGGVGGEGLFAEDGLVGEEAEHGVLVVVGVWGVCGVSVCFLEVGGETTRRVSQERMLRRNVTGFLGPTERG